MAVPLCELLGFPVAPHKVEGPSTSITFLGIEVDSCRFELRLPAEKLSRLRSVLREWGSKRSATKRRLQSLIGLLSHAATVVRQGRTFLRGLIEAMKRPQRLDQRTRLDLRVVQILCGGVPLSSSGMACHFSRVTAP